jgi:hypothetical protein
MRRDQSSPDLRVSVGRPRKSVKYATPTDNKMADRKDKRQEVLAEENRVWFIGDVAVIEKE